MEVSESKSQNQVRIVLTESALFAKSLSAKARILADFETWLDWQSWSNINRPSCRASLTSAYWPSLVSLFVGLFV